MTSTRVSVALCTYNGSQFLPEQLESILGQERLPDELVVCDDGSRDGTVELLRDFAARSPFPVHVNVNATNLRSTKNFEKAVRLCSGDLIAFSDQDDVWNPRKLAKVEDVFIRNPDAGAVFSDAEMVDERLRPLGRGLWESVRFSSHEQRMFRDGRAVDVLLRHNVVTGATMALRNTHRELVLPFAAEWVHDGWIAFLIAAHSRLELIDEPLIKYRQHRAQQLGAPKRTAFGRAWTAFADRERYASKSVKSYLDGATQCAVLSEHLARLGAAEPLLEKVHAKRAHLLARARMPSCRLRRTPVVVREVRNGNYARYSNAWNSALRDLCL